MVRRYQFAGHYLRHRQQSGLALVTVMLVVALAATIAAFMALRQQTWIRHAENIKDRIQAEHVFQSAIAMSTIVLERDAAKNKTDHRGEAWNTPIVQLPIETGKISVKISDAQGLFNLTNLLNAGNPSPQDISVFKRLLSYHNVDVRVVDVLIDWIDADGRIRPGGAEDNTYLSRAPPYRTANMPLVDVEELRFVQGFTPAIISQLRPYLVVLPERSAVNANTAPAPVLGALFANMPLAEADTLEKSLLKKPLTSASELSARAGANFNPDVPHDIRSSYFQLDIFVEMGRHQSNAYALIYRPDKVQASHQIYRSRRPVYIATAESKG